MNYQASARLPESIEKWQTLILLGVFLAAIFSLTYTALSTPVRGTDLGPIYDTARAWAGGDYNKLLSNNVYPPAMVVLTWPLSLLSFQTATIVWLILNLAATGISSYLAIKLFGEDWPWRAKYFLVFFVMSWAPFRVTLRNGQTTILIMALLLGSLLAWKRKRLALAGVLLGLALCKYTLAFPFVFYFIWQRQWKMILSAIVFQAAMTWAFVYRLGISYGEMIVDYLRVVANFSRTLTPSADLSSGLLAVTGGDERVALAIALVAVVLALVSIYLVFRRTPKARNVHFALLALLALWSVYHRTYDFMLCLIPVAVLIDFIVHRRLLAFSYFWLAAFSLLALGLPGFVASRVYNSSSLVSAAFAFLLSFSERLLVLGMFWSLLWVAWKRGGQLMNNQPLDEPAGN